MSNGASSPPEMFPSLAALRQAHVSLLQRHRAGLTATLLDEIEAVVEHGSAAGAVLDDEPERWEAQGVLDYWVAVLYRVRRNPVHGTLQPFDPSLAPELPDESCPYRGLEAFREAQHGMFFGRGRVITEMVTRLSTGRLLAILGPSGSGKSSLVLAGLIPGLKGGRVAAKDGTPASDRWQYLPPIVPGIHPVLSLASVVLGTEATAATRRQEADAIRRDPQRLVQNLDARGVPAVVVVDQFEEIFTLCTDDAERRAFVDSLLVVARSPGAAHRVVLTMRSDFEPQIATLPNLQEVLDGVQYRIPPFNAAELREKTTLPLYHFKIWLDGPPEALARIRAVQYEFDHPTFREKTQLSEDRRNRFERGYRGWGCLASVRVTVIPLGAGAPESVNFDMCAAVSFRYKK